MERTITALEVQKRNADRVSVYLDGEFAFGLPMIEASKLRKGQALSPADVEALRQIDATARAFDYAVKLLARRPYSTTEIRRKLEAKETAPPVIDDTLARLERLGYVDDLAFAQYWIENRERFRPRSPRALRYELRQKGIANAIIDEALAGLDVAQSAYRAAQQKIRRLRGLDRDEFRAKMSDFLLRRGFTYGTTRDVIDQLVREFETEQPDYFATNQTDEE